MNGFLTLVAPQRFPPPIGPSHRANTPLTDTTSPAPALLFLKIVRGTAADNNSDLQNTVNQIAVSLLQQGGWATTKVGRRSLRSYQCNLSFSLSHLNIKKGQAS